MCSSALSPHLPILAGDVAQWQAPAKNESWVWSPVSQTKPTSLLVSTEFHYLCFFFFVAKHLLTFLSLSKPFMHKYILCYEQLWTGVYISNSLLETSFPQVYGVNYETRYSDWVQYRIKQWNNHGILSSENAGFLN